MARKARAPRVKGCITLTPDTKQQGQRHAFNLDKDFSHWVEDLIIRELKKQGVYVAPLAVLEPPPKPVEAVKVLRGPLALKGQPKQLGLAEALEGSVR